MQFARGRKRRKAPFAKGCGKMVQVTIVAVERGLDRDQRQHIHTPPPTHPPFPPSPAPPPSTTPVPIPPQALPPSLPCRPHTPAPHSTTHAPSPRPSPPCHAPRPPPTAPGRGPWRRGATAAGRQWSLPPPPGRPSAPPRRSPTVSPGPGTSAAAGGTCGCCPPGPRAGGRTTPAQRSARDSQEQEMRRGRGTPRERGRCEGGLGWSGAAGRMPRGTG